MATRLTTPLTVSSRFCACVLLDAWRRFRDDGDDRSMEVGWAALQAEEKRSARLGELDWD